MSEPVDIGHGVTIRFYESGGVRSGIVEAHYNSGGEPCACTVHFSGRPGAEKRQTTWAVDQEDPLTLSPSIACLTCGHHGFIREGKWVPA